MKNKSDDLQSQINLAYARVKRAMMHKVQAIPQESARLADLLRERICDEQ